ncbi:hypothetical protein GCM10018781_61560 [Kitasatospora indigofera]|uniref:DUF485 domain-containing protein n=1 Tax=Kitasatospora indigofera TaxID=67307 RepID=A0A919G9V9_9ACTN|nr:hypothetical protein GCM10018781_61560 [Kitasatospora indigofera]
MPQQHTSSPDQGERFDWWAARPAGPARAVPKSRRTTRQPAQTAPPAQPARPVAPPPGQPVTVPPAVPAAPVSAVPAPAVPAAPPAPAAQALRTVPVPPAPEAPAAPVDRAEVYRAVQESAAFQEIRRSYRAFVFPAVGAFLGWYLLYVGAQAAAPALMRSPVAGPLNVAWVLGLLQFASTFLLTWLYARNARTRRDRAALELRWNTQDQLR